MSAAAWVRVKAPPGTNLCSESPGRISSTRSPSIPRERMATTESIGMRSCGSSIRRVTCEDLAVKRDWDTGLRRGRERIFEVRRIYNDVTFVDEFLTPSFCDRQKLFTYDFNPKTGRMEVTGRDFDEIKDRLLRSLANSGNPVIEVTDANFGNRGELLLGHRYDGEDLHGGYAAETLPKLYKIWTRPVHLQTMVEGRPRRLTYDGEKVTAEDQ